jgi:hypothetical protein
VIGNFRMLCVAVTAGLLAGCVVYPTSRTFYEPTAGEGSLRNQTGCGFLHTRDTVERTVNGVRVAVMVGAERESAERQPDLYVTLTIEGPVGSWDIKTTQVLLVPEGSNVWLAPLHFKRVKKSDAYMGSINC